MLAGASLLIVQKVTAFVTAAMMVVTLSAIAVVKADHSKPKQVATGANANSSGGGGDLGAGTEESQGATGGEQAAQAAGGGQGSTAGAGNTASGGPTSGPKTG